MALTTKPIEGASAMRVAALVHEWQTLPRWRRLELERESLIQYVRARCPDLTLSFLESQIK